MRQNRLFLNNMDMHIIIKNVVILYKKWANLYEIIPQNLVRCNNFVTDSLTKGGGKVYNKARSKKG